MRFRWFLSKKRCIHDLNSRTPLMIAVGIEDFGMHDLIRPEPSRFKIILSALINFVKFREEQHVLMDEIYHKSDELNHKNTMLLRQKTDLETKISSMMYCNFKVRDKRRVEESKAIEVKAEIAELVSRLKILNKEQYSMSEEVDALKIAKSELKQKLVL